ncbi:hypothetical protein V6N13_118874 [Hibiscus sabdariffa]
MDVVDGGARPVNNNEEAGSSKEEFTQFSDHQIYFGVVINTLFHLFRIKYYGSFDKPLGRFLRDHLFDQVARQYLLTNNQILLYQESGKARFGCGIGASDALRSMDSLQSQEEL